MAHPLFSLVVPTCDRPDTLVHCLDTLLNIDHANYEIIVMDNGSDARTEAVITDLVRTAPTAHRLRYVRGERLSMTRNWERALDHVTGEFVIFVGDDDGIAGYALSVVEAALQQIPCRLIAGPGAHFQWDDGSQLTRHRGGQLVYNWTPIASQQMAGTINRRWENESAVRSFGIYDCFVHRSIIDDARQRYGRYFLGPLPDVASTAFNNLSGDYGLTLNWPLLLRGYSGHNTAGKAENRPIGAEPDLLADDRGGIDPLLDIPALGMEIPFTSYWTAQTELQVIRAVRGDPTPETVTTIIMNLIHDVGYRIQTRPEFYDCGALLVRTLADRIGRTDILPPPPTQRLVLTETRLPPGVRINSDGIQLSADLRPLGGRTIADAVRFLNAMVPVDPAAHRQAQLGA